MFVLGRTVGETGVLLYGADGAEIMSLDAVVTPAALRRVTIQRGLNESTMACTPRCTGAKAPRRGRENADSVSSNESVNSVAKIGR